MTINIHELRRLAQAATPGPDGVRLNWLKLLKDFQEEANPSVICELIDSLEMAEKERDWHAERCQDAMTECDALEQARLNGMGASREAVLMAKLEVSERDRATFIMEIGNLCTKVEALREQLSKQRSLSQAAQHLAEVAQRRADALQAKITEMERQEPVGTLHVGSYYGEELQDWEFEANQGACDKLNEAYISNPTSLPLYALPGAKGEEK